MLVRGGSDARLPRRKDANGRWVNTHTVFAVYREMLFQICRDYPGLPDPRTMKMREILAFYEPLRAELREHTKPRKK